mmetsp:Transcript_25498/g.53900  ORF Transcript_25498/g.53900 Transcript_25498/m.53900 type:complete len:155 (+) Transcript_25498:638-1102(+)
MVEESDDMNKTLQNVLQTNQRLLGMITSARQFNAKKRCEVKSSRRSGPGHNGRQADRTCSPEPDGVIIPEPDGVIILEVDNLIKPRSKPLAKLLEERCPEINAVQPDGERSYARVRVPFEQEKFARKCIEELAAEKGKRTNVKVINMLFNSPRY